MKKYEQYDESFLRQVLIESQTFGECCDKLGYCRNSNNNKIIKEIASKYNIDISHFGFYKNLKGQRFGRLVVLELNLEKTRASKKQNAYWKCKCDCGKITEVLGYNLTSGHTQSCGCLLEEQRGKILRLKLDGQRFGKLLAININEEKTKNFKRVYYNCICDCGNKICVSRDNLTNPNGTRSCGCEKSKGELKIKELLIKLNINFISQWTIPSLKEQKPLRCDFAIFNDKNEIKAIIEFNGEQHYKIINHFGGEKRFEAQKKRDQCKRDWCKENNVRLIEISYWDYNIVNKEYLLDLIGIL